ncbi:hypothetical protein GR925_25965 [Streptomyces sp. HUCO-GS316]|uniref:hypothetical protein n=1 Tax=Streptomyces sp. HUCO-GS316 TaxID=2692198 RepID=UPI00136800BD|nr:hypothetical protein [Streptomyces sp. HUCO-GS316]MXM66784.1 hypothetical protein [Streptomyces sp. HUCO-GS316]
MSQHPTAPAQVGNGRTAHLVRVDGFHLKALCGRIVDRRLTEREAAKMTGTCKRCTELQKLAAAQATAPAQEEAVAEAAAVEAPAQDGPQVHRFADSDTAYDAVLCGDVKDGEVLVIESERIVGACTNGHPIALTEAHGQLHPLATRYNIREMNGGRFTETADVAERVAAELGLTLLPQHAAPAPAPVVHKYESTGDAYDAVQSDSSVRDGDILVVHSEGVVAVVTGAWPCAVTEENGALHKSTEPLRQIEGGRYDRATYSAVCIATGLGLDVDQLHKAAPGEPAAPAPAAAAEEAPAAAPELQEGALVAPLPGRVPAFVEGDRIVCPDGTPRTVVGMAPVDGYAPLVITGDGTRWVAQRSCRVNLADLLTAHDDLFQEAEKLYRDARAGLELSDALEQLGATLDYLKFASPVVRAALVAAHPGDAPEPARR